MRNVILVILYPPGQSFSFLELFPFVILTAKVSISTKGEHGAPFVSESDTGEPHVA